MIDGILCFCASSLKRHPRPPHPSSPVHPALPASLPQPGPFLPLSSPSLCSLNLPATTAALDIPTSLLTGLPASTSVSPTVNTAKYWVSEFGGLLGWCSGHWLSYSCFCCYLGLASLPTLLTHSLSLMLPSPEPRCILGGSVIMLPAL